MGKEGGRKENGERAVEEKRIKTRGKEGNAEIKRKKKYKLNWTK